MFRSLARISWNTGVHLGGKGSFFPFITNFLVEVANQAKHELICRDDFYFFQQKITSLTTFGRLKHKILNITIYIYIYIYIYICRKLYIYKKLKEALEIYKNQTKNQSVLAKILKVYIICTPKCDAFGNSFFPLLNIMECYNQTDDECSIFFTLHCTIRASFSHHLVIW